MRQDDGQVIREHITRLVRTNLRSGTDRFTGTEYTYLCPSPGRYRWQWCWNSCFHAMAMAHSDPRLAVRELETVFAAQEEDGFIGHINFWGAHLLGLGDPWAKIQSVAGWRLRHSALISPPFLAQAVVRVAEIIGDPVMPLSFMRGLDLYHEWLAAHRVASEDGLLVICSPHESGVSYSPAYDEALGVASPASYWSLLARGGTVDIRHFLANYDQDAIKDPRQFLVKDPMVNALYADSMMTMSRLYRDHGDIGASTAYAAKAETVLSSMMNKLWDRGRGAFFALHGPRENRVSPTTIGGLVPVFLEGLPGEVSASIVERHLANPRSFAARFPLPSVAMDELAFDPRRQTPAWRGPSSVNTNWLIWRGLVKHGFVDIAQHLARQTVNMVAYGGLRRHYHPWTGQGIGARNFAWSALAVDMISE